MIFFDDREALVRPRKPCGGLLRELADEIGVDVPEPGIGGLTRQIDVRVIE
jgi:hypothetical protein